MNENAGPYKGSTAIEARKRVLADLQEQGFLLGKRLRALRSASATAAAPSPSRACRAVVHQDPAAGRESASRPSSKGEITIVPENYKQIYLNWMRNIHDWCISRQLWWGHRIPAWPKGCGEIIVAREAPTNARSAAARQLEQDTDVLDTWFSSGLLAVHHARLARQDARSRRVLSHTLLITGYEILFFWVARMIMFGCHFMQGTSRIRPSRKPAAGRTRRNDSVPFRRSTFTPWCATPSARRCRRPRAT
jgi:valyl-tRNA synthetase